MVIDMRLGIRSWLRRKEMGCEFGKSGLRAGHAGGDEEDLETGDTIRS